MTLERYKLKDSDQLGLLGLVKADGNHALVFSGIHTWRRTIRSFFTLALLLLSILSVAQTAYFVDGYHGGVYGHYPKWKTRFILEQLEKNPQWCINLEIEPETWDSVRAYDPQAYHDLQNAVAEKFRDRIEFVNPSFAQSYLFTASGESMIRQFEYGISKMRSHFPTANFSTYSSEEPCFTSALPQVLKSFGFKYAVLKNPNTCWGGYTRAFGGEKINWQGPDGTIIPTVPRYRVEQLQENSTWQTMAWANTDAYVKACLQDGIKHPVGMCLQDAGWRGGPWLGIVKNTYQPSIYTLWKDYFEKISTDDARLTWQLSQEDLQVSLMWGSQVLQRIAQQVRQAENRIIMAEKVASMNTIFSNVPYPEAKIDQAWRTLLLSQHHDCWIVPYNGKPGNTWADKTKSWTDFTLDIADHILNDVSKNSSLADEFYVRVMNTTSSKRNEVVSVDLPAKDVKALYGVYDEHGSRILSQIVLDRTSQQRKLIFLANVPSVGYATYKIKTDRKKQSSLSSITKLKDGKYRIETTLYRLVIDPAKGGVITNLKEKSSLQEITRERHERGFNEIRGYFYREQEYLSSKNVPATIDVLEDGPLRVKLLIKGRIGEHSFSQVITISESSPVIDFDLTIDWKVNTGIGKYDEGEKFKWENPQKAFYDDAYKLMVCFPLNISSRTVSKDAPFDVTKSKMTNTIYTRWDSIKNNILLHWIDVADTVSTAGLALFTDHTTSYTLMDDSMLGLTLQYSGTGLWGRDYKIDRPSHVKYALVPHAGTWESSNIQAFSANWNEPLLTSISNEAPSTWRRSWISTNQIHWEVSAIRVIENEVLLRIFNTSAADQSGTVVLDDIIQHATLIELNGDEKEKLSITTNGRKSELDLSLPRFGIRTVKIRR